MPTEIVMPRLSDTMDSGTISKWLKHEGDQVKRGEVIAEIETDKANMDLESYANGILAQILVNEGQSALLGQPIAMVAANADEAAAMRAGGANASAAAQPEAPVDPTTSNGRSASTQTSDAQTPGSQTSNPDATLPDATNTDDTNPVAGPSMAGSGRIKASPLARRLAEENSIDLAQIHGAGPGGRITKDDVQAFMRADGTAQMQLPVSSATGATETRPSAPGPQPEGAAALRGAQPVEMTRIQRTVARRMTEARFSAPDFVLTAEYDMTEAQALLRTLKGVDSAPKVGPNDLLIRALAVALRRHSEVNSGWENDTVVRYARVNVGFAVSIEGGLVVPVIRDADTKGLGQIATEAKEAITRARAGKLAPHEYEGGTFSVSNLGMYGIEQFTPVINVPEACILGVGAIEPKPVVIDGDIVVRDRMRVTMACDHRVVNGAQGAEFLRTLRGLLERPMLALL